MSGDWQYQWDAEAELRTGNAPQAAAVAVSLPPRRGTHRRSNSTPLENTSSQLLVAASNSRADVVVDEQGFQGTDESKAGFLEDVLHGPVLTKTRSDRLRSRREPRTARRGLTPPSLTHRPGSAAAQRVSGRMTKSKAKLAVLHETFESSEEEGYESGEDGYGHVIGKGGKVKRVLANRQSAQRSRIRKLQHISELEDTLQGLQDDIFKLNPQLNKLQAKQTGLDDENKELRQKLSSILLESRHKESVNHTLRQEVSKLKLKQESEQQGQLQQQQQQRHDFGPPTLLQAQSQHTAYAATTLAQGQYQQAARGPDSLPFGSPTYSQQPSYQQHSASGCQNQAYHRQEPKAAVQIQARTQHQPQQASRAPTAVDEQDIVDRLMERYSYDQSQARQRQQLQQRQPQQQQQQQHRYGEHDRSDQQQQRGYDMLAELNQLQEASALSPAQSKQEQGFAQQHASGSHLDGRQAQASQFVRQASHDSAEEHDSPQLLYSYSQQQASPPYSSAQHDYAVSQQQEAHSQLPRQHSLDATQSQNITQNRFFLPGRVSNQQAQLQMGTPTPSVYHQSSPQNPSAYPQGHSYNGGQLQQQQPLEQQQQQQQLRYRSQSLTQPMQQPMLQRHSMSGPLQQQQQQQQQQHDLYQRPQSTGADLPIANEAVRHLQRHSTGQMHPDTSPHFMPFHSQSQPRLQPDAQSQLQLPSQSWSHGQSQFQYPQQPQIQPQTQRNAWDSAVGGDGRYQQSLPNKKSSGDMSRHGSGSTEGPLSDYLPPDSILRSFSSVSNASSEHSDSAAHAISHLGTSGRTMIGNQPRSDGQTGQYAGSSDTIRYVQGVWAKGMPPSGKKKKDSGGQKAALTRLI